jgi:hypothetical protein
MPEVGTSQSSNEEALELSDEATTETSGTVWPDWAKFRPLATLLNMD